MLLLRCLVILLTFQMVHSVRPFTINLISYDHTYNTDYYRNISVQLLTYKGNKVLNGSAIFRRNVNDYDIKIQITFAENKKNVKPRNLIDVRLNACDLIKGGSNKSLNLVYLVVNDLKLNSHILPQECPVVKDTELYIRNFAIDVEMFPPNVPPMKLNFILYHIHQNTVMYNGNITVSVKANKPRIRFLN